MENLVGFGLLGFFLWTGYHTSSYTMQTYAQMAISGIGGAYMLISNNIEGLKALIVKKSIEQKTEAPSLEQSDPVKDFQSISYLRDRCQEIASPEAVDMTVQINTALFKSRIK